MGSGNWEAGVGPQEGEREEGGEGGDEKGKTDIVAKRI